MLMTRNRSKASRTSLLPLDWVQYPVWDPQAAKRSSKIRGRVGVSISPSLHSPFLIWQGVALQSQLRMRLSRQKPGTSLACLAGVIQLFGAVVSLWTLAKYLEYSGHVWLPLVTIPLIYLLSGVAGCLVSANLAFEHDSTGSSAAVCGLLGNCYSCNEP